MKGVDVLDGFASVEKVGPGGFAGRESSGDVESGVVIESEEALRRERKVRSPVDAYWQMEILFSSPHNPRLDLFHGIAQGSVAEVALGDLEEAGTGPAGLEE